MSKVHALMTGNALALVTLSGCMASPMLGMGRAAHSPTPYVGKVNVASLTEADRSIVRRVHLDAPKEEVFAYLTDFEAMPDWMPGLKGVTVDHRNSSSGPGQCGLGTIRVCNATGATVSERVVHFDAPHSFAYTLYESDGPGVPIENGATGVVSLASTRDGGTDVEYHVFYETKPWHPMGPVFPIAVGKQMGKGMENLATRFGGAPLRR